MSLLLIIVLILLLGGGGGFYGYSRYGGAVPSENFIGGIRGVK